MFYISDNLGLLEPSLEIPYKHSSRETLAETGSYLLNTKTIFGLSTRLMMLGSHLDQLTLLSQMKQNLFY